MRRYRIHSAPWARRLLPAVAAFVLTILPGLALDYSAAFDEANKLYEQGKYGAAADAYEQLIKDGQGTPAVFFNLGNSRFKSGELGRAVLAYLKAERLSPRDPGIRSNLQLARHSRRDADEASVPWHQRWLGMLRANEWAGLTAVCATAFFLLLSLGEWRPAMKPRLKTSLIVIGLASVASMVGFLTIAAAERRIVAVVVVREALVRYTPLEESPILYTAADGTELVIVGEKGAAGQPGWFEVQDGAKRTGWVKHDQVDVVKDS